MSNIRQFYSLLKRGKKSVSIIRISNTCCKRTNFHNFNVNFYRENSFKQSKSFYKRNFKRFTPFNGQKFSWINFSSSANRRSGSSGSADFLNGAPEWPRAPKNTTQFLITDCEERESAERELHNEGVRPRAYSSCSWAQANNYDGVAATDSSEELDVDDAEFATAYNDVTWERIKTLSREAVNNLDVFYYLKFFTFR